MITDKDISLACALTLNAATPQSITRVEPFMISKLNQAIGASATDIIVAAGNSMYLTSIVAYARDVEILRVDCLDTIISTGCALMPLAFASNVNPGNQRYNLPLVIFNQLNMVNTTAAASNYDIQVLGYKIDYTI